MLRLVYVFGNDLAERQIPIDPSTLTGKLRGKTLPFLPADSDLSRPVKRSCSKRSVLS